MGFPRVITSNWTHRLQMYVRTHSTVDWLATHNGFRITSSLISYRLTNYLHVFAWRLYTQYIINMLSSTNNSDSNQSKKWIVSHLIARINCNSSYCTIFSILTLVTSYIPRLVLTQFATIEQQVYHTGELFKGVTHFKKSYDDDGIDIRLM